MKRDQAFAHHKQMCDTELKVRARKAKDYSADKDVLSNFALLAEVCAAFKRHGAEIDITTPHGYAMFMVLMKLVRIQNIVNQRNGDARNEALEDSVLDGRVYLELWYECYEEWQHEQEDRDDEPKQGSTQADTADGQAMALNTAEWAHRYG